MEDAARNKALLEALLFISGEPLSPKELKEVVDLHEADIEDLMEDLIMEYAERDSGVLIGRIAGGYQMHTNPRLNELLRKFSGSVKSQKLSPAALETLAIIAYRQPVTKAEVENLRGVNSDGIVKSLLEKRLIKIMGKKEAPGRPLLYGTTREFLQYFSLNDLTELPTLKDLEREDAA
jgi:segregation and condensation protein B